MEALRPSSDERVQRRDLGRSRYDRRRVRKIEMYEVVETNLKAEPRRNPQLGDAIEAPLQSPAPIPRETPVTA